MRISYIMAGLLSFVLCLSSFIYAQTSSAAPPQQPATPSQGPPGAATPGPPSGSSSSPATQPQTSTTPGTTPGASQASPQSANEDPLNLTAEQKAKLRPILDEERQQMDTLRADTSMTTEQKMAKAQQIREAATPKIKAVLTSEQLQKLSDMQKARQLQQSAPSGNTGNTNPPPQ